MKPSVWGKYVWDCIHILTLGYPLKPTPKDKKHYKKFLYSLSYVLPCDTCRANMRTHLEKLPLTDDVMSHRSSLVKWGIDLHNIVNYYTGKEMLTYTEALNQINKLLKPEKSNYQSYLLGFGLVLVIFIILFFWYRYRKN